MVRNESLKKDKTTLGIIDSKSIKNVDTAEEKGYDAGKKVSGTQRPPSKAGGLNGLKPAPTTESRV